MMCWRMKERNRRCGSKGKPKSKYSTGKMGETADATRNGSPGPRDRRKKLHSEQGTKSMTWKFIPIAGRGWAVQFGDHCLSLTSLPARVDPEERKNAWRSYEMWDTRWKSI